MGCSSGQKQQTQNLRLQTANGILKVTIINARIQHQTSSFFAMDPYVKLKVSNQSATSKILTKGGKDPIFNESFEFFINSCYQLKGRHLQLQLWDSNKTSDSLIGFGITDLDPILQSNTDPKPKQIRIFLNYDIKPAGTVVAEIEFKQQPIQLLTFRFQTVSIRRKTSTLSNMNCFVKVTIGEEVLKTKKKKDTIEMPPVWVDDFLMFNVPKVIKNCLIEVFDEGQLVGECLLKIEDLLKESKEKQYDEDIFYQDAIAGTLRFQTLLGQNPQFSEVKRDYKRKVEDKQKKQAQISKEGQKGKDGEKDGQKSKVNQKAKEGEKSKQILKSAERAMDKPIQQVKKE